MSLFVPYRYFGQVPVIGIEADGKSQTAAFQNAASALFAIMAHPATVLPERHILIEFDSPDPSLALTEWLNRLIGQAGMAGLVLASFALHRQGNHYSGEAWGMPWKKGADTSIDLKSATVSPNEVRALGKQWRVRCIVHLQKTV